MIGGKDIHLDVSSGAAALDLAVRAAWREWPQAVFVADGSAKVIERYDELQFRDSSEIIVYKDLEACRSWREIGYDPSLKGTMLYLISDAGCLTMVVEDNPSREIEKLTLEIKKRLRGTFLRPAA